MISKRSNVFIYRPEFIERDNRKDRQWNPTTVDTLYNRFSVMLPSSVVECKSILDLGACIGASGAWCLDLGATSYTAVEIQDDYFDIMNDLLGDDPRCTLIKSDLLEFFKTNTKKYDVVILSGILYAFVDYYNILKEASLICDKILCIDTNKPKDNPDGKMIELGVIKINSALGGSYKSLGSRIGPVALNVLLGSLGFSYIDADYYVADSKMYVEDRYISNFKNTGISITTAQDKIKSNAPVDIPFLKN